MDVWMAKLARAIRVLRRRQSRYLRDRIWGRHCRQIAQTFTCYRTAKFIARSRFITTRACRRTAPKQVCQFRSANCFFTSLPSLHTQLNILKPNFFCNKFNSIDSEVTNQVHWLTLLHRKNSPQITNFKTILSVASQIHPQVLWIHKKQSRPEILNLKYFTTILRL